VFNLFKNIFSITIFKKNNFKKTLQRANRTPAALTASGFEVLIRLQTDSLEQNIF
jgi:hypothetical protein